VVATGVRHRIDLGRANGKHFFNVASIGLSVTVARMIDGDTKKRWGSFGYALTVMRAVGENRPFRARVTCDGRVRTFLSIQLAIGNGRHYGGGMTVERSAEPDDGQLDVYSLEVKHWWQLLALFPAMRSGTHGKWDAVRTFRTTEFTVRTGRPRPINTDGELTGETPAHFRLIRRAVRVYAPRGIVQRQTRAG
jgi:diacylglycerol kinase family enzyme